jgi:glutamate dehydrogenase/leucine dehydrogenase
VSFVSLQGPSGYGSSTTCYDVAKAATEDIKGKVVLITGTTSGIGKHTALALAQQGATVVLACRNAEAMHTVADDIKTQVPGR